MTEDEVGVAVEEERLKAILESLLFAAGEPVALAQLANALDNVPRDAIRKALAEMAVTYASGDRGIVLEEIAGGYQLRTPKEHALYVRRLLAAKPPRLSRPLLETLSIVAYRQPVTRPEIEQLRGVDSGGVLDTLIERSLIKIARRKEAPGRPMMYATTVEFLELFGLKDLENLPDLAEFRALEDEPAESRSAQDLSGESLPVPEEAEAVVATSEELEGQLEETQELPRELGETKKRSDNLD
jgi:segregation and condensation protein B